MLFELGLALSVILFAFLLGVLAREPRNYAQNDYHRYTRQMGPMTGVEAPARSRRRGFPAVYPRGRGVVSEVF